MSLKSLIATVLVLAAAHASATDVMFFIDAEDYTSDYSNDALRDLAKLMSGEGVKAHVNVVGYLARKLRQQGRDDVFAALKPHLVGSHTLYYAKQPTVAELTDVEDADQAYRLAMAEESLSLGLIKSSFGIPTLAFHAPSGPYSYAALYAASDLGMTYCVGSGLNELAGAEGKCFWYCGMLQLPCLSSREFTLESLMPPRGEPDYAAILDRLAAREFVGLRLETSFVACKDRWLKVNFNPKKPVAFGEWKPNVRRPPTDLAEFYRRLRRLIALVKADQRFRLVTIADYNERRPLRQPITLADVPFIRSELNEHFGPLDERQLSLADIYQATVEFLRGETRFTPGRVRGFLTPPEGVRTDTVVSADELRLAAGRLVDVDYIPSKIQVGAVTVGPADLVMAGLEILETQAKSVTLKPREQLGKPGSDWKVRSGKDRYLSERLRLQSWTMRHE